MSQSSPGQYPISQADISFAVNLLNQGDTPETVQAKLTERGMPKETAIALLNELVLQVDKP